MKKETRYLSTLIEKKMKITLRGGPLYYIYTREEGLYT